MTNKNQHSYNLQTNDTSNSLDGLKLILKYTRPYIFSFLLVSICLLTAVILGSSIIPQLIKRAIDINIAQKDNAGLLYTSLLFSALVLIYLLLSYIRIFFTGKLGQRILFNIRNDVFKKLQTLPSRFFSDNPSGDIIQRLTGNVDGLNIFFSEGIIRFLDIIFSAAVIIISIFLQSKAIGIITIGGTLIMIAFVIIQGKVMEKPIMKSLQKEGDMSAHVQESLEGFVAIQANNQQDNWIKNFEKKTKTYFKTMIKVAMLSAASKAIMTALGVILVASILVVSLNQYRLQIITIGTIVLILTYLQDLLGKVSSISEVWKNIKTGIASAQRLKNILTLQSDIENIDTPYYPKEVKGNIEFRDVDFSYVEGENVLSDVNFTISAGQTIAIVGPTGAGKTTFVNLIARLFDVDSGGVYIDNQNVKYWDLNTLRKNIGYLIQDTFLFEDTILNNLRYNNPKVSEKEAINIFKQLGVSSFISSLPDGLDTIIEANTMSAGQRQIIALARILLRNPKILILDEATARIDTQSEKLLQRAIEKACRGKTTFIIAHRLSTIFNADKIILIKNNTILEQGTHQELLKQKGFYYDMYSRFIGK